MEKNLLLVLPLSFYSFGETLSKSLTDQGYLVQVVNDEFPANLTGKLLGKLGALSVLRRLTLEEFKRRYSDRRKCYDVVLIIKGRGVGPELIELFKQISEKVVAYNFDSFEFNPSPLKWMNLVDKYCTFDIKDAQFHDIPLVHLFSALPSTHNKVPKCIDVSVLMKNHSQRLAYTDLVISSLPMGISKLIYIFEPNWLSAVLGALKNPLLYIKYWRHIHFKPMPYEKFLEVLGKSRVTVDYAHPSQTGITIRCFEASSLGVSIITNNPHVVEHPFFQQNSVAHVPFNANPSNIVNSINGLLAHPMRVSVRGVDQFLHELLEHT